MPSRDWDDSWYDDDEFPPVRQKRGRGAVVTVAVFTFIMCGFNALSATCLLPCGILLSSLVGPGNGGQVPLPAELLQHGPLLMVGFGIGSAVAFVLQIVTGIGLVNNRRWARTMSFYLAGYSVLTTTVLIYVSALTFSAPGGIQDDTAMQAMLAIIGLVFHVGYAATVFLVLLNRRVAASLQ